MTTLDLSTELVVIFYFDIAEYQGTRATLEAEGVIPSGTNWPAGFESSRWDDGQFYYWLRRQRPEGAKGPRKQFLNVDWWMFRFEPMEREDVQTRHLRHKAKELADIQYGMTIKGRAEINAQWKRFYKASTDERFQVFKAACGIVEEKRGRPRKKIETQQEKSE